MGMQMREGRKTELSDSKHLSPSERNNQLRKVNFLACKPSHGPSVLWIHKCLYQLVAPEEGTASLSTQSLAPAPESYHSALGVINLSDDMPLRCLSETPFPKGRQALSRGSETEGRGKPRACITSM